jgi:predicted transcriptional regulator
MANSTEKMKAGINAVTVAPTQRAAARLDAYMAGVQRAVQSGKMADALNRVTLQDWQRAAIDKGINRVAGGAAAAKPKFQSFMNEFLPFLENARRELESMPRGGLEENIQRAVTMMRKIATFRRTRS